MGRTGRIINSNWTIELSNIKLSICTIRVMVGTDNSAGRGGTACLRGGLHSSCSVVNMAVFSSFSRLITGR